MSARGGTTRPVPEVVLVTGGAGFIGANAVGWLLRQQPTVRVITYDAMTYAAHPETLPMVTAGAADRHHLVRADVRDREALSAVLGGTARDGAGRAVPVPDTVWHLAAESHVDRSILGPDAFVETNIVGTERLLEAMRRARGVGHRPLRLVHVSTDEVYGSLEPLDAPFTEARALAPSSPYAASKAAADLLVQAWARTYGLDAVITRCSNNYGPFQFPEKLLPLMVTRALAGEPLPVYGDGRQVRDWLHAEDHVAALWAVTCQGGSEGRVYNIGGNAERENLAIVRAVLRALGKDESLIAHVRDRPAHDRRYAMDASRLRAETDWRPRIALDDGLAATVEWYVTHEPWWRAVQRESAVAAEALYLGTKA
ncbi:MAG: dTDP-glucose 4,6-dehydratase [Gemmatimonadaceae bacterium]